MFVGAVYFKYTPKGYIVDDFIELNTSIKFEKVIFWKIDKVVRLFGTFNFTPIKGQFCKRPHRLLVWSK